MKKTMLLSALCLAAALFAGGCGEASGTVFAMDTYMRMSLHGVNAEAALEACQAEIERMDALLSVTRPESDISRLNASGGAPVVLAPETAALLNRALALSEETGGAFQPAVLPMCRAWGFSGGETHRVPAEETRAALVETVRQTRLAVDGCTAVLTGPSGAGIDLGGVAKGYLGDCLAAVCEERGVRSALFDLGGNVQLVGKKPDGKLWNVGVQDPLDPNAVVGVIAAEDTALVTAGSYQRYFETGGARFHHLLDPETGAPAESGLLSVTVIMPDGTAADALATALFVMGADRAEAFWRARGGFEMVLILSDGTLRATTGASFTPLDESRCATIEP